MKNIVICIILTILLVLYLIFFDSSKKEHFKEGEIELDVDDSEHVCQC